MAIRSTTKTSAPNWRSCAAPWNASTTPIRKAISATMGTARSPTSSQWCTSAVRRNSDGWRTARAEPGEEQAEVARQGKEKLDRMGDGLADLHDPVG